MESRASLTSIKSSARREAIRDYYRIHQKRIKIRRCKHLNSIVEQDHRQVKRITPPMMGFKNFHAAQKILVGIEAMAMIKKGQMKKTKGDDLSPAELFYALACVEGRTKWDLFAPCRIFATAPSIEDLLNINCSGTAKEESDEEYPRFTEKELSAAHHLRLGILFIRPTRARRHFYC